MLIINDKLYLAGGTSVSPAVFNLADGKCLNDPASKNKYIFDLIIVWQIAQEL